MKQRETRHFKGIAFLQHTCGCVKHLKVDTTLLKRPVRPNVELRIIFSRLYSQPKSRIKRNFIREVLVLILKALVSGFVQDKNFLSPNSQYFSKLFFNASMVTTILSEILVNQSTGNMEQYQQFRISHTDRLCNCNPFEVIYPV